MADNKISVSVHRAFEVEFEFPQSYVAYAPPLRNENMLDRVAPAIGPERWRIRFKIADALDVAETLAAVSAKIVALVKEKP
jgi:hypothetical protein